MEIANQKPARQTAAQGAEDEQDLKLIRFAAYSGLRRREFESSPVGEDVVVGTREFFARLLKRSSDTAARSSSGTSRTRALLVERASSTFSALNSDPLGDPYRSGVVVKRDQLLWGQHLADRFADRAGGGDLFCVSRCEPRAIALAGHQ